MIFFFSILLLGCIDIRDVIMPGDKPVIEAYLMPENPVSVKVFTETPYTEADSAYSKPITGLNIVITGNDDLSLHLVETEAGIYTSTQPLGKAGAIYAIKFEHNGREVYAETILPDKPEGFALDTTEIYRTYFDFNTSSGQFPGPGGMNFNENIELGISWKNPDNLYHFVAAQSMESDPSPVVNMPNSNGFFQMPNRFFNNQPVQGEFTTINGQSFEYFGKYAVILYKLNSDYAALYENQNTSSQNISTPISMITNGLGIFTGINADTLIVNVNRQ